MSTFPAFADQLQAAINLSNDTNMPGSPATRNTTLSVGMKRPNVEFSPSHRNGKSRRTTPSFSSPDTDEELFASTYISRQREQEARLAREAEDEKLARQLSQSDVILNAPVASSSNMPAYNAYDRISGRLPSQLSKTTIKPEPAMESDRMGGWRDAIELTDDSDFEEIGPAQFQINDRKRSTAQSSSRPGADSVIDLTRNMDGSLAHQGNPANAGGASYAGMNRYPPHNSILAGPRALAGRGGTLVHATGAQVRISPSSCCCRAKDASKFFISQVIRLKARIFNSYTCLKPYSSTHLGSLLTVS